MMKRTLSLSLLVIMVMQPAVRAGQVAARAANAAAVDGLTEHIELLVGRSAVIRTERPISRVALSTPEIADALVTSPRELLVHGKAPGTISLLVWGDNGRITTYDVAVLRDLSGLDAQIKKLFPSEPITVASAGKDVVLSGVVSTKYVIDRAASVAAGYVEKAENIVNLLRQQESVATNQVMLKVRFAEVSRSAMQELGASFFTGPMGKGDWIARGTTQQYPAPEFEDGKLVFSDFLNLFAFNTEEQLGSAIRALKGRGLFESLAEPNLITQDGVEASFLAGGEYPYPVVQPSAGSTAVTIIFKEFGVRLKFTPTITSGDYIQLKVMPEVSTLDFTNSIILEGFRVPALATRRTETQVELRDGQTFAIAGLLDRSVNETLRRVPGIGDIPILGYLFRSQAYQKNNTELVVMITPHIVRRDSSGVTPNLPNLVQPFMGGPDRQVPMPPPAFSGPQSRNQTQQPAQMAVAPPLGAPVSTAQAATTQQLAPVQNTAVAGSTRMSASERRAAEKAARDLAKRQEVERKIAEQQNKRAQELAVIEEARLREAAKVESKRQEEERRIEEKRAAEQAVIDRKRWLEQQEQAARAKTVADKLAKEQARRDADQQKIEAARLEEERKIAEKHRKAQEKLAKEHAQRDEELERLIAQYKKLSEGQAEGGQSAR
jgi:pilus assembly protein CpaC